MKTSNINVSIDVDWVLNHNIREILRKASDENWEQDVFDRWLRIKEVQALGTIAAAVNAMES